MRPPGNAREAGPPRRLRTCCVCVPTPLRTNVLYDPNVVLFRTAAESGAGRGEENEQNWRTHVRQIPNIPRLHTKDYERKHEEPDRSTPPPAASPRPTADAFAGTMLSQCKACRVRPAYARKRRSHIGRPRSPTARSMAQRRRAAATTRKRLGGPDTPPVHCHLARDGHVCGP